MKDILSEIIAHKQTEIELQKQTVSPEQLQEQAGVIIRENAAHRLLKEGRISMSGLYSEKTGRTYDAEVILDDTGGKYVNFKLEFPVKKGRRK